MIVGELIASATTMELLRDSIYREVSMSSNSIELLGPEARKKNL